MELTRDRAGHPWRTRHREILSRIVRETEAPTDSLPRITHPERNEPDDSYDARVGEVLDLAGSIGAILTASGSLTTAVMDQVTAIAAAYGIERCEGDVINTAIHVAVYRGPTSPPATTLHIVQSRSMDFTRLAAVDRLIRHIRADQVSSSEARDELDAIVTAPHPYKRWIATLAWGALAFATAGTLGGSLLACLVSALSAMAIYLVNRRLNKHGLPLFFQYAIGGAIATAPPLALYGLSPKLGMQFEPTVAIAAGLVVLLAGLSLVRSVGDVITGAPVTAAGRFFELLMMTGATIAGVALVLHLANRFGAPFVALGPDAPPALAELPARVAFGAASAAAYALAAMPNAPRRWLRHSAVPRAPSRSFWRRAQVWVPWCIVRRSGADRLDRPADGTPQSRPTTGGVDHGHRAPVAGLGPSVTAFTRFSTTSMPSGSLRCSAHWP